MNMIITGDRMNLGFTAKTAECTREDDAVVIFMEWAAPEFFRAVMGFSETFAIK